MLNLCLPADVLKEEGNRGRPGRALVLCASRGRPLASGPQLVRRKLGERAPSARPGEGGIGAGTKAGQQESRTGVPRQGLGTDKGWKCWRNIRKVGFVLRTVGSHGRILSEGGAQLGLEMRKNFLGLACWAHRTWRGDARWVRGSRGGLGCGQGEAPIWVSGDCLSRGVPAAGCTPDPWTKDAPVP